MTTGKCVVCGSQATKSPNYDLDRVFFSCPVCGRYELGAMDLQHPMNYDLLAPYLLYNSFRPQMGLEYRYHTTLDKDTCDRYRQQFDSGNNTHGRPVHMDADLIEAWYPKSFAEKIDKILLYFGSKSKHIGERFTLSHEETLSALFVDRYEYDMYGSRAERPAASCRNEATYILHYLADRGYIDFSSASNSEINAHIQILPDGYSRIDILQKNTALTRRIFSVQSLLSCLPPRLATSVLTEVWLHPTATTTEFAHTLSFAPLWTLKKLPKRRRFATLQTRKRSAA